MKPSEGFAWLSLACVQTRLAGQYLAAAGQFTTPERHVAEMSEWCRLKRSAWFALSLSMQCPDPRLP